MRSETKVRQRLKQAVFRRVKKELASLLAPKAPNCKHNFTIESNRGPLALCGIDGKVCDASLLAGGSSMDRSGSCGEFLPKFTREEVKSSIEEFLATRPLEEVTVRFPEIAMLRWILDDEETVLPDAQVSGISVYFDSQESQDRFQTWLGEVEKAQKQGTPAPELPQPAPGRKWWWQLWPG